MSHAERTQDFIASLSTLEASYLNNLNSTERWAYYSFVHASFSRATPTSKINTPSIWYQKKYERYGLTHEKVIAKRLGVDTSTVMRDLKRAKQKILDIIKSNPKRYGTLIDYWREL